jgi:hypothetical protein
MWSFEHSVQTPVSRAFAWQFWTNVANWPVVDPSVESVQLNGPFAAGTSGTTKPRGLDLVEWHIREVQDGHRAVIEIPAPGVVFKCVWLFADAPNGGTRITQQASLEGELTADFEQTFGPQLENGMPQAMGRLIEEMARAAGQQA